MLLVFVFNATSLVLSLVTDPQINHNMENSKLFIYFSPNTSTSKLQQYCRVDHWPKYLLNDICDKWVKTQQKTRKRHYAELRFTNYSQIMILILHRNIAEP